MSEKSLAATIIGCAALFVLLATPLSTQAQAWLPAAGEGQVTFTYQNIFVRDHLDYTGKRFDPGHILTHTKSVTFEYGLTNKLTLDADINYVASRFLGPYPPEPHGPVDTGSYHPTFQDLRIGIRYNVFHGPVVITPSVAVVIPTHHYEVRGHSAVGRDLNELQLGVNVARDLEGILPGSYVEARVALAIVERINEAKELNLNRSDVDWEVGHFATNRLSVRFVGTWRKTYGGLDFPLDDDFPHFHELHDRAVRANFIRLGGGASFSLTRSVDLHADYLNTISGINTHAPRGISLGISYRFSRGFNGGGFSTKNTKSKSIWPSQKP
jgi:hypothetical protein